MTDGTDSYNKIKRLSTEELEKLWYDFSKTEQIKSSETN